MSRHANAAVFLDRDGTIVEDRGHLRDPDEVVFFPDTFEALQKLQKHLLLFVVTNQPGVAEGLITRSDVDRVNAHVIGVLAEQGVEIRDIYVCPHGRSEQCLCMKPKPYFLREAAERYGIDLSVSFTVGDHPHDVQLAANAGAAGIYVLTGHGVKHLHELPDDTQIAYGIGHAAEMILSSRTTSRRRRPRTMQKPFLLNLMVAQDLWWRPDLGDAPRNAEHVARVLREAGIEVYEVSSGWLECEPRPAAIHEALTGRPAPAGWAAQFDCPPERQGSVLRLLAAKAIPVGDCEVFAIERGMQTAAE